MKVASALISSAYSSKIAKPKPPANAKTLSSLAGKGGRSVKDIDQVDLKSNLSLEKIQQFLTSEIGKKVDQMMTDAGIDLSQAAGLDWSPEATSSRIFDMTTGLFGVWREQHSEMSEKELINSFEKVIRSSVDKGYQQAAALISTAGFGEQTGDVSARTMSLLHEKYDAYFEDLRNSAAGQVPEEI